MTKQQIAVFLGVSAASALYSVAVAVLRDRKPDHNTTPLLVVVGVALVLAGYAALRGKSAVAELAALFAVAGVWQVAGYYAFPGGEK